MEKSTRFMFLEGFSDGSVDALYLKSNNFYDAMKESRQWSFYSTSKEEFLCDCYGNYYPIRR